jgi:hypothetical protein
VEESLKDMNTKRIKKSVGMTLSTVSLAALAACSPKGSSVSASSARFDKTDGVQFVQDGVAAQGIGDVSAMASGLSISLALTMNPPPTSSTGGQQLYASDLKVLNNRAFATYNVPGAVQKGWIDYIDVTVLGLPILLGSTYYADTDINSVAMNGGKFAIVGSKDQVGSVVTNGTYSLLGYTVGTSTYLDTSAGTGATYNAAGTALAITSGSNGGLSLLDPTALTGTSASLTDARGVAYSSTLNRYFVVKGSTGEVHSYDASGAHLSSVSIGGATIAESKATIQVGSEFLLATKGDGGFTVLCASDLGIAATQAAFQYPNYAAAGLPDPTQTVTNAAVFGPGMIFVASGAAGVRVYNFIKASGASPTACQNVQVSYMGYFEFNTPVSVNNLSYSPILTTGLAYTGTLFVAAGLGGFKAVNIVATPNSLTDIIAP